MDSRQIIDSMSEIVFVVSKIWIGKEGKKLKYLSDNGQKLIIIAKEKLNEKRYGYPKDIENVISGKFFYVHVSALSA
jgi:hypothetical protein